MNAKLADLCTKYLNPECDSYQDALCMPPSDVPAFGNVCSGISRGGRTSINQIRSMGPIFAPLEINKITRFAAKGGVIVFAPLPEDINKNNTRFCVDIRPEDYVVPICHAGENRSQILHVVLMSLFHTYFGPSYSGGVSIPHGAESGFDPYQGYDDLSPDNLDKLYSYIHGPILPRGSPGEWLQDNFFNVFGVEKAPRIGQAECVAAGIRLNPDDSVAATQEDLNRLAADRTSQRMIMDNLLYNPDNLRARTGPKGRVIVFAFARVVDIFLSRLLEVSGDYDMSGICIVALPFPDIIPRAGGMSEIDAYFADTGKIVTRDYLSCMRHEDVFGFYCSLIRPVCYKEPVLVLDTVTGAAAHAPVSDTIASLTAEVESLRRLNCELHGHMIEILDEQDAMRRRYEISLFRAAM